MSVTTSSCRKPSFMVRSQLDRFLSVLMFRYGFLAVFAATDGGITRVFPNK